MRLLVSVLAFLQLAMFAAPSSAQLKLKDIESSATGESERVQQLMSALENPDPNYRMHAFLMIVEKGSDYERRLALQRAFLGTDVNLRNAALKKRLSEMPLLRLELSPPEAKSDRAQKYFGPRSSAWLDLKMSMKDEKTGLFDVHGKEALVIDDQFMVGFWPTKLIGWCHVELALADDLSLQGPVNCEHVPKMTARAPLF